MSNAIRRKPKMTKANPYNDIKLLFCVIICLLFIFVYKIYFKKQIYEKKNKFKYELICATTKGSIRADSKRKFVQNHEEYSNKL